MKIANFIGSLYSLALKKTLAIPFTFLWWIGSALASISVPVRQHKSPNNLRTQLWKDFLTDKLRESISTTEFGGSMIRFSNRGSQEFWRFKTLEIKEPDTVWWLRRNALQFPTATLLDIGANVGIYTIAWLSISQGRANSFEPLPGNVEALVRNLVTNGMQDRSEVIQVAVANIQGLTEIRTPSLVPGEGFASVSNLGVRANPAEYCWKVPSCRLDDIDLPHGPLIVKIDVEGHELEVIEGMKGLLRSGRVLGVLFEKNARQDRILGLLRDAGLSLAKDAPSGGNLIVEKAS